MDNNYIQSEKVINEIESFNSSIDKLYETYDSEDIYKYVSKNMYNELEELVNEYIKISKYISVEEKDIIYKFFGKLKILQKI